MWQQCDVTPHNTNLSPSVIPNLIRNLIIEQTCEEEHTSPHYNKPLALCHSKLDLESHTKPRVTATMDAPCCPHVPYIQRILTKFSMRFRVVARNDMGGAA